MDASTYNVHHTTKAFNEGLIDTENADPCIDTTAQLILPVFSDKINFEVKNRSYLKKMTFLTPDLAD